MILEMQFDWQRRRISKVEKRQLWKCKWICICDEIPMRERDECGNAMKIAFTMRFQSGKEIKGEVQLSLKV